MNNTFPSNNCVGVIKTDSLTSDRKLWLSYHLQEPAQPLRCQGYAVQTWHDNDQRVAGSHPVGSGEAQSHYFELLEGLDLQNSRGFCLYLTVFLRFATTPDDGQPTDKSLQPVKKIESLTAVC